MLNLAELNDDGNRELNELADLLSEVLYGTYRKPRVRRVPLKLVPVSQPFTYRGITYIKAKGHNMAYRLFKGTLREMAPDCNVRLLAYLCMGDRDVKNAREVEVR